MSLSNELISQFVKVTQVKKEEEKESIVYGTIIKQGLSDFVKIDGAEMLTPVSSTSVVKDGERVTVMIKNHTAVVTGNLTSPSAQDNDLKKTDQKVNEFQIIFTNQINAEKGRIDDLITNNLLVKEELKANKIITDELVASNVTINGKLTSYEAQFTDLKTHKLDAEVATLKYATIDSLNATDAKFRNLESDYGEFKNLSTDKFQASEADITSLKANKLDVETANITFATIKELKSDYITTVEFEADIASINKALIDKASIESLEAVDAKINKLTAGSITTDYLETNYAKIDLANIKEGCITTAMIGTGVVGNAQIADGSITDAKIVNLTANKITAGKLDAAEIEVVNLNAANITVGTINGQQIAKGTIDWDNLSGAVEGTINEADTNATKALDDALNAFKEAEKADSNANIALETANGKNKSYYQKEAPTGEEYVVGDTWYNTAKDMQMSHWNGASWIVDTFGADAIKAGSISADKISSDVSSSIDNAINSSISALEKATDIENRVDSGELDGKDAILIMADSSNGTAFRNSKVATILTITVIVGDKMIDSYAKLVDEFGDKATIKWQVKNMGETDFVDIPDSDPRINDHGFIFTISAKDVKTKAVFNYYLDY